MSGPQVSVLGAVLSVLPDWIHPRQDASVVPRGVIINHCTVPGVVALTFDDGPYKYTSHVLDLLDQYDAKATFFVNGDNWVQGIDNESQPWPSILRRMVRSGHQVGSHTFSHVDMTSADSDMRYQQLHNLEESLTNVLGVYPAYFRPPYATCDGDCLTEVEDMGYHVVNFDIDTKDYANNRRNTIQNSKDIFSTALDAGRSNDSFLVLCHDVQKQTAMSLVQFMLDKIQEKGYRAVTVGECLGDPTWNCAGNDGDWFNEWWNGGCEPLSRYFWRESKKSPSGGAFCSATGEW
ncbi:hypothetical protein B0T17DRAFT_588282 [Bombardia bombarda]|uniref:NodB homology domain-containing protein n=1 Tax=Bombardia bombarda TaxID=252184 RepID=A0AA39XQA5_9PEZI|nr:hypothetical protein B0T17DRAFT_588282 [Bombardia bombarda]